MIETRFPLKDVITVARADELSEPLNLTFRARYLPAKIGAALTGSGLYLITYCSEVVYIGKYQPLLGNILNDRWLRHLETMTLRGNRVGFGGAKSPAIRLQRILCQVSDPGLRASLMAFLEAQGATRFRDTGVVTSVNRVGFANEFWDVFRQHHDHGILSNFEFRLLRIGGVLSQADASSAVSAIEKAVLATIKPRCNKEFSLERHAGLRFRNTIPEVVSKIQNCTAAIPRMEITKNVVLCG